MNIQSLKKRIYDVKIEWQKFVEGKPPDPVVVTQRIIDSWQRSRNYGVCPVRTQQVNQKPVPVVKDQVLTKQHLFESKQWLRYHGDKYNYVISLYNSNGLLVNDIREYDGKMSAAENILGTNAICLCMMEDKQVSVLASEHYNIALHDFYCTAAPIHDREGKVIGAVNALYYDLELVSNVVQLVQYASKTIDLANSRLNIQKGQLIFEQILNCLPQGIANFRDGRIQYCNSKMLELLRIRNENYTPSELEKLLERYVGGNVQKRNPFSMYANGQKRNFQFTILDEGDQQIVLLEDKTNETQKEQKKGNLLTFDDIVGVSKPLLAAKETARKVAGSHGPVLLVGESGTGKELFAQAIHCAGPRKKAPFMAINCGAIPSELVESELFGYEPGAFTGALKSGKKGFLESATGGTVFLDEIESMPLYLQVKLLRALSAKFIVKVGGVQEIPIDVRIISASKKDLLEEVEAERFRDDLYYRINTFCLTLPPLRERKEDIPVLAEHLIQKIIHRYGLEPFVAGEDFLLALKQYTWRGNVRELENVLERALYLAEGRELTVNNLPEHIRKNYRKEALGEIISVKTLREYDKGLLAAGEELIIQSVLKETAFNIKKSSIILGVSQKTLYNKIRRSHKLTGLKF